MEVDSGAASTQNVSGKDKIKIHRKKESKSREHSGSVEDVAISSPSKRNNPPGVRLVVGRIYDSVDGKNCHQCRHKTRDFAAACTNQRNNKPCHIVFCRKCLLNRYGEKAEGVSALGEWSCPKCRGICNCSVCMKKRGHQPTGALNNKAKATGFSSVSEMLLKGVEHFANMVASPNKEAVVSPRKRGKENSFDGKVDANLPHPVDMKSEKVKAVKNGNTENDASMKIISSKRKTKPVLPEETHHQQDVIDVLTSKNSLLASENKPKKMKRYSSDEMNNGTNGKVNSKKNKVHDGAKKLKIARDGLAEKDYGNNNEFNLARRRSPRKLDSINNKYKRGEIYDKRRKEKSTANNKNVRFPLNEDFRVEIPLPMGRDLGSVAGIDVDEEDVGGALQFLEFCAVFGKILEVKKGQPENILRDLLHGRTGRYRKLSTTVQFYIQLISVIQTDRGEDGTLSPGKNSWFHRLKKCLSESGSVHKAHGLDSLDSAADYVTLTTSKKLRLLNFLCDEVLGTEKVRNWIDDQNAKHAKKVKEARQLVTAAKDKAKRLKHTMQDDIARAIIVDNGSSISISEHEAIVSRIKAEAAQAHAKVLVSKGKLNDNMKSDAVRVEPIFNGRGGHAYWKLNCIGKSDVVHQNVGNGDPFSFGEKWFAIDAEGKEAIEKHICSLSELLEPTSSSRPWNTEE